MYYDKVPWEYLGEKGGGFVGAIVEAFKVYERAECRENFFDFFLEPVVAPPSQVTGGPPVEYSGCTVVRCGQPTKAPGVPLALAPYLKVPWTPDGYTFPATAAEEVTFHTLMHTTVHPGVPVAPIILHWIVRRDPRAERLLGAWICDMGRTVVYTGALGPLLQSVVEQGFEGDFLLAALTTPGTCCPSVGDSIVRECTCWTSIGNDALGLPPSRGRAPVRTPYGVYVEGATHDAVLSPGVRCLFFVESLVYGLDDPAYSGGERWHVRPPLLEPGAPITEYALVGTGGGMDFVARLASAASETVVLADD